MSPKAVLALLIAVFMLIGGIVFIQNMVGWNDAHEWQVYQSATGHVEVISTSGPYLKLFGKSWEWPLTLEAEYTQDATPLSPSDDSIEVTFNDGGTAKVSSYVKVSLPTNPEQQLRLHREFGGNQHSLVNAIKAHLTNCIKASGPVMSASENQAARKAEFNQIVEEQLSRGLFKMNRTEIELDQDVVEQTEDGKTIQKKARVFATEIVNGPDGHPIVIQQSPLENYGIMIRQFSITEINYDPKTKEQFSAKKESYLAAERAKAQRQEEVQQRLMVEERGRRQGAEIEASENLKKITATIAAQQAADVAVIAKKEAVTKAAQKTEVAEQERMEALKLKETAKIKAERADLDKQATISAAEAQKKVLELGGGMSERDRVLAEIAAKRDVGVAEALSKLAVPTTVINGGAGSTEGSLTSNLMNMVLLEKMGIVKEKQ